MPWLMYPSTFQVKPSGKVSAGDTIVKPNPMEVIWKGITHRKATRSQRLNAALSRGKLLVVWADAPFALEDRQPANPAGRIAEWQHAYRERLPPLPWSLEILPALPILSLDPTPRLENRLRANQVKVKTVMTDHDVPSPHTTTIFKLAGDLESRSGLLLSWEGVRHARGDRDKRYLLREAAKIASDGVVLVLAPEPDETFARLWEDLIRPALVNVQAIYVLGPLPYNWPAGMIPIPYDKDPADVLGLLKFTEPKDPAQDKGARRWGAVDTAPAPPDVSVRLLNEKVPTAYCYQLTAENLPLVTVRIDNTGQGCGNAAVRISAVIDGYSSPETTRIDVMQGKTREVALLPGLQPAAIRSLNEIRPASITVQAQQIEPVERELYHKTHPVQMHAYDTALLALKAPDGSMVDLTDYLAAWVTPRHAAVERLLRQAADYPPHHFVGYQNMGTLAQSADFVREQVAAIFLALKEKAQIKYVSSPLNLGKEAGQMTQRVRLPADSLEAGGSANCIDGTVLFASVLALASLNPVLVLVPGHAFVGWQNGAWVPVVMISWRPRGLAPIVLRMPGRKAIDNTGAHWNKDTSVAPSMTRVVSPGWCTWRHAVKKTLCRWSDG